MVAKKLVFDREQARPIKRIQAKLLTDEAITIPLETRAIENNRDPSNSGEAGIRTLDALAGISVFETDAFNRSATSPFVSHH